ncbi:MAG: DapH/DapD/GlmU-related protein [Thermoanaerobaculia bacterium]
MSPPAIHPTAIVEEGVEIGNGTRVWDHVHIRKDARIGRSCIIGEKTYIAYDVVIGDCVKVNTAVYICTGVTVEDFCMLSAHVVFTNDRFPRAGDRELTGLETSDVSEETLRTRVGRGATVGANATIGPGITLGTFSMVGMGAVVTRDVPARGLVVGNPARLVAWVCQCGPPLVRFAGEPAAGGDVACTRCGRRYAIEAQGPRPLS